MKTMVVAQMSPHRPAEQTSLFGLEIMPQPAAPQAYIYRWDRQGRKGQTCQVTARGKFNSIRVVFSDGFQMITSGNAIRKVKSNERPC